MSDESKNSIMIVDDSPQEIHLLLEELKSDFVVTAATSADDALERLQQQQEHPDIILLDVNMPGTNGYEACEKIKYAPQLMDIDVIFLSANDNTEEIIRGLDAGAADYITKPYEPNVLRSKIRRVIENRQKKAQLREQADVASKLVYTVMSESGSLGNIVTFLRTSFTLKTVDQLIHATIEALKQYDINAILYFNIGSTKATESTSTPPTMLELDLLERLYGHSEPFLEKGKRAFVIQKNIVVLIKNMPIEEEKRGSLKDNMKILLEGANAQLAHLAHMEENSSHRIDMIHKTVLDAKNALDEIHSMQEVHKKQNMQILDEMVADVEKSFFSMALTDTQEKEIMDIMTNAVNKSLDNFESGIEIDKKIKRIVIELSQLAANASREA